ncbi:hypothetical protein EDD53_0015 [Pacificibacter maritimus]|uniref:Uncharacterized protein n=1 Tax=Pacificibacter maritimus TaxID=762213 RepID=A0A3N4UJQ2_9RHOB|nr:hypothetical protein EDD53_0015 [Pacificibacter maritimus]
MGRSRQSMFRAGNWTFATTYTKGCFAEKSYRSCRALNVRLQNLIREFPSIWAWRGAFLCNERCEFIPGLSPVFDGTKSNDDSATFSRGVHLTQSDCRLAIVLLVESHQHAKSVSIVFYITPMDELYHAGWLDPQKLHAIWEGSPIQCCPHVESPTPTNADIDLMGVRFKAARSEPLNNLCGIDPSAKCSLAIRIDHAGHHHFPFQLYCGPRRGDLMLFLSHWASRSSCFKAVPRSDPCGAPIAAHLQTFTFDCTPVA